jgi:hypothetical protein
MYFSERDLCHIKEGYNHCNKKLFLCQYISYVQIRGYANIATIISFIFVYGVKVSSGSVLLAESGCDE